MSNNDRLQENNKGTMGTLFRRMTMASLGLDAMDDVSEQSFEVIDRADTFAERLLGGVTRMMPRDSFDRIGIATSSDALWKEVYSGILPADGPKNATDVGEWQYWLDAVLLTLFDEEEEDAEFLSGRGVHAARPSSSSSSQMISSQTAAAQTAAAQTKRLEIERKKQEIRERVAQLNASGVKPAMLRQLSVSKQREIAQTSHLAEKLASRMSSESSGTQRMTDSGNQDYATVVSAFATALIQASEDASPSAVKSSGRVVDLFASNSNQILASHILEKAKRLEASGAAGGSEGQSAEAARLMRTWRENVERFSRSSHQDGSDIAALHEMQRLVREMSSKGIVAQTVADQFRMSSRTFAARALDGVLSQDQSQAGSTLVSRIENGIQSMASRQGEGMLVSSRAVTSASPNGIHAAMVGRAEHLLATSFEKFSSAVRSYVDRSGSNAATMRFERASERYEQLAGLSDEQDRVLLRDLVESATQLETSGIIPRGTVSRLVRQATSEAELRSSQNVGMREQIEMLQRISSGAEHLVSTRGAVRNEKLGRQFSRLMHQVDHSLNSLVTSLKNAGIQSSVIAPLIRDITQIQSDGIGASVEAHVNCVEMLSHSLDSFVERALGALPEQGYDALDTDRAFVAPETVSSGESLADRGTGRRSSFHASGSLAVGRVTAQLEEVRRYVASVAKLQHSAEEQYIAMLEDRILKDANMPSDVRSAISQAIESRSMDALMAAQKSVASRLAESVNAQIDAASKRIETSRMQFEAVSKQVREIERAAEISRMLRIASDQAYAQNIVQSASRQRVQLTSPLQTSVLLDGTRIENSYLPALNEAIQSYAKLREEYARFDTPSLTGLRIEETTARLNRMMTLIQPAEQHLAGSEFLGQQSVDVDSIGSNTSLLDQQFGYDEIVPDTFDKVRSLSGAMHGYASVDSISSYAPMLGSRKALELHASGLLHGNVAEAGALKAALGDVFSSQTAALGESVTWSTVNALGERVRLTVANDRRPAEDFILRAPIGESYQPAALRGQAVIERSMTPVIDIQKLDSVQSLGGAEQFVPVMLGGAVPGHPIVSASGVASSTSFDSKGSAVKGSAVYDTDVASDVSMNNGRIGLFGKAVSGMTGMVSSLGGFERYEGMYGEGFDGDRRLLSVSLDGTHVAMTPEAYVQTIAEPQLTASARALSFGSDALYGSFASLLSQQGASRSLSSLRRTFFEKLSAAGRSTARGWIGLNSQSFASLLGIEPDARMSSSMSLPDYDAGRGAFLKSDASSEGLGSSMESFGSIGAASHTTNDSSVYSEMANAYMRSYVSGTQGTSASSSSARGLNAVASDSYGMQLLHSSAVKTSSSERQQTGELLGHIDSLLDYVEDISNRNVGVFSTNEMVRVLVEQLPRESYLGEKGLPKWRQKDVRSRQVEEARELREALKKIGASPVQGMQRIHDKNFVSPNLIPQTTSAAPLFSGGSDGGSTPTASSSLRGANSHSLDQSNIPTGDLEIIAEEVYEMILESLNEELQRRRSE